MGSVADEEVAGIDAMLVKVVNLFKQRCRVDYHSITDYADCSSVKNTRRNKMKSKNRILTLDGYTIDRRIY